MYSLIIFASGAGTNAAHIINYFKENKKAKVSLIVCNVIEAGVLKIAEREKIPHILINKLSLNSNILLEQIADYNPDLIVLAGFLLKIPSTLLNAYNGKIINIHPSLLPEFGGKGMYGNIVHQAVLDNKKSYSGITIHYVNEVYDGGNIILQVHCNVLNNDTAATLAEKIHKLEYYFYPRTIEFILNCF